MTTQDQELLERSKKKNTGTERRRIFAFFAQKTADEADAVRSNAEETGHNSNGTKLQEERSNYMSASYLLIPKKGSKTRRTTAAFQPTNQDRIVLIRNKKNTGTEW